MKTNFKIIFCVFLAVLAMTVNSFASPGYIKGNPDGSQTLTGHVPHDIGTAFFKYHASLNISAQIIMPLQNQPQLSVFLKDLYDPASLNFHHFLSPSDFGHDFGPSQTNVSLVLGYLKEKGIRVTGQSPNGAVLYVSAPVGAFEQAFGVQINQYQKSDGTSFYATVKEPVIPATLAGMISAIGGMDNLPKYMAHRHHFPQAMPKAIGSGPGGYLAPNDVKTAYNLNAVPATGAGQSVALFELDGYASKDITAYESYFSLPGVPLQNVLVDGFNGVPNYGSNGGADEVTLDIELVAAFAPGSSNILVYEASNTSTGWID